MTGNWLQSGHRFFFCKSCRIWKFSHCPPMLPHSERMRTVCFLAVLCEVAHVNEIPCRSSSPSAAVSPKPLCYLLASVLLSSCFGHSSQTSAADSVSWLLHKRLFYSILLHGGGLCNPKYSPSSPFCTQLVDGAASLPAGADEHFSCHTMYSQWSSKDGSWCFMLACQLGIEIKTLLQIFMVGAALRTGFSWSSYLLLGRIPVILAR